MDLSSLRSRCTHLESMCVIIKEWHKIINVAVLLIMREILEIYQPIRVFPKPQFAISKCLKYEVSTLLPLPTSAVSMQPK